MNRRTYLTTTAAVAIPVIAGCSGGSGSTVGTTEGSGGDVVETTEVSMVGSQFDPRNIHIQVGATVTWTNDDSTAHTVTSASENWSFDTEVSGGGTTEYTYEESGVYDVYCRFHGSSDLSGMSMKVGVGDAPIESPLGGSEQDGGGVY